MKNQIPEYTFRANHQAVGFEMGPLSYFFRQYEKSEIAGPHRIDFNLILFITDGAGKHEIDFKTFSYKKGDLIFIRQGQVHKWYMNNKPEGLMIFFTADFFYNNQLKFNDISFSYPFNIYIQNPIISLEQKSDYETFHALTDYMYREFSSNNNTSKTEILQCLLRTVLLKIHDFSEINKSIHKGETLDTFVKFHSLLEKKISVSRNVIDYCNWLGISYDRLNDVSKELTNKTVKQYIDELIIPLDSLSLPISQNFSGNTQN